MAFEAEVSRIFNFDSLQVQINIDNAASSFDASYSVAFPISKAADGARWVLQWAFSDVDRMKLVVSNVVQVPHVDELLRVGGHQKRKLATHQVNWLAYPGFSHLCDL